jgi:tetratricopeptide (TPR) repeat protein
MKIMISFHTLSEHYPEYQKDALELSEILVNVHPREARSHTIYGDFLYRDKKLKDARDQYAEALKYDKSKFAIWNQVMIIDSELHDTKALEAHSKEAMELFPSQPLPLYFAGAAQIQLKNYKGAIEPLLEAKEYVIDNNPLLTQIFASLGDAYNFLKDYENSDKAFEDALKLDPDNTTIMNNYSYYLSLRKTKLERAEKFAARANELEKTKYNYMDTYGWILFQEGKLDLAKEWIEKALKAGGERNGVILEHYGDILFKLNNPEKALEYWKKAKETGRGSENIDKKIAEKKLYE